jgi:hypothetical protein
MKKALIVLLILGVAGAVFAQDLKFDGQIRTGLVVGATNVEESDPVLYAHSVSAERRIGQFRLNGAYTNAEKTAGAKFRLQFRDYTGSVVPALPWFFGYVNLFENAVTLNAGLIDDGTFGTGDAIYDDDNGEGLGGLAILRPGKDLGLEIGLGAYTGEAGSFGTTDGSIKNSRGTWLENGKYTISAAYALKDAEKKDVFKLVASYRTEGQDTADVQTSSSKAYLGFRLFAVKDWTFNVGGVLDKLYKFEDEGIVQGFLALGFAPSGEGIKGLKVGLNGSVWLPQADNTESKYVGWLWVSYALAEDTIVPRLDLVYGGNQYAGVDDDGLAAADPIRIHRKYIKDSLGAYIIKDASFFSARPSVTFNIDKKTFIEIGDLIHFSMNKDANFASTGEKSLLYNAFYIDFSYTF